VADRSLGTNCFSLQPLNRSWCAALQHLATMFPRLSFLLSARLGPTLSSRSSLFPYSFRPPMSAYVRSVLLAGDAGQRSVQALSQYRLLLRPHAEAPWTLEPVLPKTAISRLFVSITT